MKNTKFFAVLIAAGLLLTPACALAKTHVSFSLNLFDCLRPMCLPVPVVVAPPPPPPVYFVPVQPVPYPHVQKRKIVKEYHHHHYYPIFAEAEEIRP